MIGLYFEKVELEGITLARLYLALGDLERALAILEPLYEAAERLGLLKLVPGRLGQMVSLLPPPVKSGPKLPKFFPAIGRKRARVAFFVGCVADAIFRPTHWATLRVLQQNGCDVEALSRCEPEERGCSGCPQGRQGVGKKRSPAGVVGHDSSVAMGVEGQPGDRRLTTRTRRR